MYADTTHDTTPHRNGQLEFKALNSTTLFAFSFSLSVGLIITIYNGLLRIYQPTYIYVTAVSYFTLDLSFCNHVWSKPTVMFGIYTSKLKKVQCQGFHGFQTQNTWISSDEHYRSLSKRIYVFSFFLFFKN